jgi:lipid A 4'-phosphatase
LTWRTKADVHCSGVTVAMIFVRSRGPDVFATSAQACSAVRPAQHRIAASRNCHESYTGLSCGLANVLLRGRLMVMQHTIGPSWRRAHAARALAVGASLVGIAAGVLFTLAPDLDLVVARQFYVEHGGFAGVHSGPVLFLRAMFKTVFIVACTAAVAGLVVVVLRRSVSWRAQAVTWLYLVMCLGVGPGLVTNTLLKDQWGRARPAQIVEFGGSKAFTPALQPADQCARNCSFVSGEASSMFAVFYAAALIVPHWSVPAMIAGTIVGLAAGLVRVAQGGHFLSDVMFAGVFMALTTAGLHRLLFGRPREAAPAMPEAALDHAAG